MFLNPIQQGRDANNNPITPLTDKRFNQPFHVYDVSYDSGADQLNFNVGVGRAVFDGTVVEQTSETTFSFSNPSASTTYHIYLNDDGSYRLEQTGNPISIQGSTLLSRLDTPSDLNSTGADDLTDLRNMLAGGSGMSSTRKEIFTSDGTFPVPSGVSTLFITIIGGGGGGGEGYDGNNSATAGSDGGNSSFGSFITANGGDGGQAGDVGVGGASGGKLLSIAGEDTSDGTGGDGGRSIGHIGGVGGTSGGSGSAGINGSGGGGGGQSGIDGGGGGGGAGEAFIDHKITVTSNTNHTVTVGSGGAGGAGNSGGNGGDGGDGIVIVQW